MLMICDYRPNGCIEKIMLEHFDRHVSNCDFEMRTCKFTKCSQQMLRKQIQLHEMSECEHREIQCTGDCGLMIALSDKPLHNCVTALKENIDGIVIEYCCF